MRDLITTWYTLLSGLSGTLTEPITAFGDGLGVPLVSVLLFGLLGATSPCQLTTGAGALAYLARRPDSHGGVSRAALAYLLGKMLVYTLAGVVVILAGQGLAHGAIPVVMVARKLVGPLMLALGVYLLGFIPLRFSVGQRLTSWLERQAGPGTGGAFLLGVAFAFTVCPTLFLLFFGLTVPLALRSPVGLVYPAVFALGTSLPLLGLAGLLAVGVGGTAGYLRGARRVGIWLRPIAAVVLLLAGLHDTVVYWFL